MPVALRHAMPAWPRTARVAPQKFPKKTAVLTESAMKFAVASRSASTPAVRSRSDSDSALSGLQVHGDRYCDSNA